MTKFAGVATFLLEVSGESPEITLTFEKIERLIGTQLPSSAHEHFYWHGRDHRPHVRLLAEAGWSAHLDPMRKSVSFRRVDESARPPASPPTRPVTETGHVPLPALAERMHDLKQDFRRYVDDYTVRQQDNSLFGGPSVYFHKRTLQRLQQVGIDAVLSESEVEFYELLYATLASWGMHRMGPRGAKLVNFCDFRASIIRSSEPIRALQYLTLCDLHEPVSDVANRIVAVMNGLSVGRSETKMVACTKTLHHLLPDLVPPIDRQYTLWFFYAPTEKTGSIDVHFSEVYGRMAEIAAANRGQFQDLVRGSDDLNSSVFNTSKTKVVDNAIMEYVLTRLPRPPKKRRGQRDIGGR